MIELNFKNENDWLQARLEDVTSTEVSALFHANPYTTEYELWYKKKHKQLSNFEATERMEWGKALEDSIAKQIAKFNGWEVKPFKTYGRLPNLRAGSSFDYIIEKPEKMIFEIKNVDYLQFRDNWIVTDGILTEAPLYIEFQVQHQMMIMGINKAVVGLLVSGNEHYTLEIEANLGVQLQIRKKIAEFWESIDNNTPPIPDFDRDSDFISSQYNTVDDGKTIEANEEIDKLVEEYYYNSGLHKETDLRKKESKAKTLMIIEDTEKVLGKGYVITAKLNKNGTRVFKVNYNKDYNQEG